MTGAREGWTGVSWKASIRVVTECIGMMGRRQVTPSWADDHVRKHVGGGGVEAGGGCPPPEENQ